MPKKRRDLSASYEITGDLVGRWYRAKSCRLTSLSAPRRSIAWSGWA